MHVQAFTPVDHKAKSLTSYRPFRIRQKPRKTHADVISNNLPPVGFQAGTVLMAKDDDNGQTILMLAASRGDVDVFEMIASKLPHPQVRCARCCPYSLRSSSGRLHPLRGEQGHISFDPVQKKNRASFSR